MKIMYIDLIFGISGDMMLAALLHAGYPFEQFLNTIKKIPLPIPEITPEYLSNGVIKGVRLDIKNIDKHLTIADMERILNEIDLHEKIKKDATGMLGIIIEAESKIHNISRDELHFHELSNIDTLIDLIGVASGIHYFGIEKVFCGAVPCGRGFIKTSHGIIPNPPPVTLEILKDKRILFLDENLELTTPTGAAILSYYAKGHGPPPMKVEKIGYGMGTYKTDKPDVLRIFIGESEDLELQESVWVIETDIDDMDLEYIPQVMERIREAGAIDCLFFPVHMKKGRIGVRISILVNERNFNDVKEKIFLETTTFGIRIRKEAREVLKREIKKVSTPFGDVRVKYGYNSKGECIKTHIEFEDIKRLADEKNIPYLDLYREIKKAIQ